MDLALLLRRSPDEIELLPYRHSIALLERHYEREEASLKLRAKLHGYEVTE